MKYGMIALLPVALGIAACGTPIQHIASDCRLKNQGNFADFASCTKQTYAEDPTGTDPTYSDIYLSNLRIIEEHYEDEAITNSQAFLYESQLRMELDRAYMEMTQAQRAATTAALAQASSVFLGHAINPPNPQTSAPAPQMNHQDCNVLPLGSGWRVQCW